MKNNWKRRLIVILLVVALTATMVSFTGSMFASAEVGGYYSGITATSGQSLLGQLHDLITTTHTHYTSYNDCKNPAYVKQTDPGSSSSYVMEFYSQADISSTWGSGNVGTWNREHVWCQSLSNGLWGETGGGADMHHIRPVESGLNSTRGNDKFGDVNKQNPKYYKDKNGNQVALGGYLSGGVFEPIDEVKGDVARIVMYVYTHYNDYKNVGGTTNGSGGSYGTLKFTNVVAEKTEEQAIALLLKWNEMDPVDDIERTRNEAVYEIQGNRNPFIDNENYAKAIWGGEDIPITKLMGMTMDVTSLEVAVGLTKRISLNPIPADADATSDWTSSDESVATVSSSGFVKGISEGTAVITATSVSNPSITASATVTVKSNSGSDIGDSGVIIINQESFDMTTGYSFKNWSSGGIGGIAYIYGGSSTYPIGSNNGMQFNISKDSYYIASNIATQGPIKSVTVTMAEGKADRPWKLLTSDTAYGEVAKKPTNGTDHGTMTVTADGVTWELEDCTDTYFALTCEATGTSAASYISSIVIEYGTSNEDEVVATGLEITPNSIKINEENASIDAIKELLTVNVLYSDDSKTPTTSYKISGFNASKIGTQIVTITVEDLSKTITVVVEKNEIILPPVYTNVDDFISSVDAIANAEENEAKYNAIMDSIKLYKDLSEEDKAVESVVEKYQVLQNAVDAYNQNVEALNSASEKATENSLYVCVSIISALAAVVYILTRKMF